MPCGGKMDVYIEPHFSPRRLLIAGQNKLARHLSLIAQQVGYAVTIHGPETGARHWCRPPHHRPDDWLIRLFPALQETSPTRSNPSLLLTSSCLI